MDGRLLAYLSFTTILAATPGATTAVVVRNTLTGGWRTGLMAALGAATANSTYAVAAAVGLAVFIAHSPTVLQVLRIGGGLYIGWLAVQSAIKAIRSRDARDLTQQTPSGSLHGAAYQQGLLTNILNPPIITFYLVVIPSFLEPGAPTSRFALFAALHVTIAFICHTIWATAFHQVGFVFSSVKARRILDGATALALAALAVRVVSR